MISGILNIHKNFLWALLSHQCQRCNDYSSTDIINTMIVSLRQIWHSTEDPWLIFQVNLIQKWQGMVTGGTVWSAVLVSINQIPHQLRMMALNRLIGTFCCLSTLDQHSRFLISFSSGSIHIFLILHSYSSLLKFYGGVLVWTMYLFRSL